MMGLPVTDPQIVRRRLFLIGGRDLGADGIAHSANVGHWQHAKGLATQSNSPIFSPCQSYSIDSAGSLNVCDLLQTLSALR